MRQVGGAEGEGVAVGVGRGDGHAADDIAGTVGLIGRRRNDRCGNVLDSPHKAVGAGVGAVAGGDVDGVGAGRLAGQAARDHAGGRIDAQARRQVGGGEGERVAIGVGRGDGHAADHLALVVGLVGRRRNDRCGNVLDSPHKAVGAGVGAVAGGDVDGVGAGRLAGQAARDHAGGRIDAQARRQVGGGEGERVAIGVGRGDGHAADHLALVVGLVGRRRNDRCGNVLDSPHKAVGAGVGAVAGGDVDGVGAGRLAGQAARDHAGGRIDAQARRQVGGGESEGVAVAAAGSDGHAAHGVALVVGLIGRRGNDRSARVDCPREAVGAGVRPIGGGNVDGVSTRGRRGQGAGDDAGGGIDTQARRQVGRGKRERVSVAAGAVTVTPVTVSPSLLV